MSERTVNNRKIDEALQHKYAHYFECVKVSAKKLLLREGQAAKKMYYIEKGCIRGWFNNNGKDVTVQFFFENNTVASLESFRKNIPSLLNLETIEPSTLWVIQKKDFDQMFSEITKNELIRNEVFDAVFERTFDYMKHFFSFVKDSPEQRYLHLLKERPEVVQRVPQHYIASFLGISSVHLSRIKNKLAGKKTPR